MPRVALVDPKNEELKKFLRHPRGTDWREDGTASWPDDQFTLRRLRDGDVMLVTEAAGRSAVAAKRSKTEE